MWLERNGTIENGAVFIVARTFYTARGVRRGRCGLIVARTNGRGGVPKIAAQACLRKIFYSRALARR